MTGRRVLVVDDSSDVLILLSASLEAAGFEVQASGSTQEALAGILEADRAERPFHLVITDLDMPRERGTVLIKAIRDIEDQADIVATERLPIILLTALEPGEIPEREGDDIMRLGLTYLHKSSVSERLVPTVEKLLGDCSLESA